MIRRTQRSVVVALTIMWSFSHTEAAPIFASGDFTVPVQIIDYENSPVGTIQGGTSITNQYASFGALHDGSTTTPPGPSGMSSLSGLPGLESFAGDPDPNLPITIIFTTPVTQVGAFYLMGESTDSITLEARRADSSVIESVTVLPADMPLQPGPLGYNEGFVGLIASEPVAALTFTPDSLPFVIDDLHFGVPEPSAFALVAFGAFGLAYLTRRQGTQLSIN